MPRAHSLGALLDSLPALLEGLVALVELLLVAFLALLEGQPLLVLDFVHDLFLLILLGVLLLL